MKQKEVFSQIEVDLLALQAKKNKPIRLAINGIEGTGKTSFAKALCNYLSSKNWCPIHVSIDGFHYNKAHRYRQGRDSASGYYEDSYDEETFVHKVLLTSQNEDATIIMASHDLETDEYLKPTPIKLKKESIIISDGAYLFKPVFLNHWDYKIYLKTDFETAKRRGAKRDASSLGGEEAAALKFEKRYHAASKLYLQTCHPMTQADLIIDMTDFEKLVLLNHRMKS